MRNPLPKVTDTGRVGVFLSTLAASKLDPSPVLLYGLAVLGAMLILWEAVSYAPKLARAHPVQVVARLIDLFAPIIAALRRAEGRGAVTRLQSRMAPVDTSFANERIHPRLRAGPRLRPA
jgi:hypothetical protein